MSRQILVIDDSETETAILRERLEHAGYRVAAAPDGKAGLRALYETRPDLVLLDVVMPGIDGWKTLELIREISDVPVIMLTARHSEIERVRGLRGGADDYVGKPFSRAELTARIDAVLRRSTEAIVTTTKERVVTTWNAGAERLYGWSAADAIGRPIAFLLPPGQIDDVDLLGQVSAGERVADHETIRLHRDGSRVHVAVTMWPLFDESGSINGYGSLARDISKQRAMQRQQDSLIEAQKLESLGVLAGGIAHNFNNLLHAILANADLALSTLPADSPVRERIEQIELAGTRAAELARDMLTYSGRSRLALEPVELPALVEQTGRLVSAGNEAPVAIRYRFDEDLPLIVADANQIRQVVLSLITNAAEALSTTGGSIEVRADLIDEIPAEGFRLADAALDGPYVRLEVEDSGIGMDDDALAHLFDPFFTTKFTGRGLGLAAVLGIVRGHGGAIRVTSKLGSGTLMTLLFPCAAPPR